MGKKIIALGREFKMSCQRCSDIENERRVKHENDQKKFARARKVRRLVSGAAIPLRFLDRDFDNYIPKNPSSTKALRVAAVYAEKFSERLAAGGGLIFCGKPGTGKTHLSCAIANYIMREGGYSALFTSVLSMSRRVKETYSRSSEHTERYVLQMYEQPDLLIIDEVGVQFGSDAEKLILFEIVNSRYESMRPTILISNLPLVELTEYVGERIVDRMREGGGAMVSFDWDSFRGS